MRNWMGEVDGVVEKWQMRRWRLNHKLSGVSEECRAVRLGLGGPDKVQKCEADSFPSRFDVVSSEVRKEAETKKEKKKKKPALKE